MVEPACYSSFLPVKLTGRQDYRRKQCISSYIIKTVATIALFICAFNARMTPTVSARIIVATFYFSVFGVFGLLIFNYFNG